jgi:hypothetical protein
MGSSIHLFRSILFTVCRLRKYCPPCMFLDSLRAIAANVSVYMELLSFSCTCTYVPNSILQCLSYVSLCPVMIVIGLIVVCTPSLWGKLFRIHSCTPFRLLVVEDIFQMEGCWQLILFFVYSPYVSLNFGYLFVFCTMFIFMPLSSINFLYV